MNCQICYNDYDHSIHKPYSLSNCSHTFCIDCLNKLTSNKCPICKAEYKAKHPNLSLMEFIPKSSFDKAKEEFDIALKQANILENILKITIEKKRDENISKIQDLKTQIRTKRDDLIKLINNSVTKLEDELSIYEASLQFSTKILDSNSCTYELYIYNTQFKPNEVDEAQLKIKLIDIQNIKTKLDDSVVKATNYNESIQFTPLDSIDAITGCFGILKDERSFEYYQRMGRDFMFEKKIDESLFFFKKAIQTKPSRIQRHLICSVILANQEHFNKSKYNAILDCFNLIISNNTNDCLPYFYRGEILQYFKMLPEAINSFTKALQINPTSTSIKVARERALKIYEDERERRSQISNAENVEPKTKKQKV